MIRVVIVEDDPEFREWLEMELEEPGFACVGSFDMAETALAQIPQLRPDITIMDLQLERSDIGGIECMLRIKLLHPTQKFLVMTAHGDDERVFEALKVGAGAYILKNDIPRKLIHVLDEFHRGGAPMSAEIAQKVITSFHKSTNDLMSIQQLSPREKEILDLLSKGYLYKEIASQLPNENDRSKTISEGTVKIHAHKIYQKLHVNNRTEAINKYLNH